MEKEIKVLGINLEDVAKRLQKLGARKVFDGDRAITHFDTADGAYAKQNKYVKVTQEEFLKLTVTTEVEGGSSIEYKTRVGEDIFAILEQLSLQPIAEVTARRISFELDEIDFDIDFFPGIPSFLEVDIEHVDEQVQLLEKLGLQDCKQLVASTPGIFAHYGKDYFQEFKKA
ncbi:hypothetical protein BH11PAT4_BH11PAT4_7200 [soil metagenome]